MRLFLDRARAADPRFELTAENAEDVARICRALEGVPLAIELAAARIRALTPAAMLRRLDRMLPLLVTAARDIPERQRTIQATVEWSIDLLSPEAQALFVRLGVFAGDFSLDAVEAVTARAPWATDLLGILLELVDGSLLRQHDDAGIPLYSMLVPVREIASARFELEPNAGAVRRVHGEHYLRLAAEIEPLLQGSTQSTALARLEAERDNLRAAYRHLISVGSVDVGGPRRLAPLPLLVDPQPARRGEGVDGGHPACGRTAARPHPCDRTRPHRRGSHCRSRARRSIWARSSGASHCSMPSGTSWARPARSPR